MDTTRDSMEERFAQKFVSRGTFGERQLTRFFVNNLKKSDPISLDDQVLGELEAFILAEKELSYQAGRQSVIDERNK